MKILTVCCGFSLVKIATINSSLPFFTTNEPFYLEFGAKTTFVIDKTYPAYSLTF